MVEVVHRTPVSMYTLLFNKLNMLIVPVTLPCATGDVVRYRATILTPFIQVTTLGLSHLDAVKRCLLEFNSRTFYDESYND